MDIRPRQPVASRVCGGRQGEQAVATHPDQSHVPTTGASLPASQHTTGLARQRSLGDRQGDHRSSRADVDVQRPRRWQRQLDRAQQHRRLRIRIL